MSKEERERIFIGGNWVWDDDGVLTAYNEDYDDDYDDDDAIIDTIATLALQYSDPVTTAATKRLIARAPDMYSLLDSLSRNLAYSGLTREARRDVRDMLCSIDYGDYDSENSNKLTAYAFEMFKFIKQLANGFRINNWAQICEEAKAIVKAIDGDKQNEKLPCPKCGARVAMKESSPGAYTFTCPACGYTACYRTATAQEDGITP